MPRTKARAPQAPWEEAPWLQGPWLALPEGRKALPQGPGVYAFLSPEGRLLYVGKSVALRQRVRSYFGPQGGHTTFTARLKSEAAWLAHRPCGSELEALLVEAKIISKHLPPFNLQGRRVPHHPFLRIPQEPYPRLLVTREVLPEDEATYLGPFPGRYALGEALEALRPILRHRDCDPMPKKACFAASVGRCDAPCVGGIEAEAYEERIGWVVDLFEGRGEALVEELEARMRAAAAAQAYEVAALWRDRLQRLQPWLHRHRALAAAVHELDVFGVLPDHEAGHWLWLLIRRGRLVWSLGGISPRRLAEPKGLLAQALKAPPPAWRLAPSELGEVSLLASWLHRHPNDSALRRWTGEGVEELVAWARARMRGEAPPPSPLSSPS